LKFLIDDSHTPPFLVSALKAVGPGRRLVSLHGGQDRDLPFFVPRYPALAGEHRRRPPLSGIAHGAVCGFIDLHAYLDAAVLRRLWVLRLPAQLRKSWEQKFPALTEISRVTAPA
jgi:hypothetical protein